MSTQSDDPPPVPAPEDPRWWRWVPWAVGGLLAAPTLIARYPPMTDLPHHEAVIALLRHLHDPAWFPQGVYHTNFGHPNQLFVLVGWALSYLLPTDWVCKLLVAATVLAIPVCAARLARHLDATPWTAAVIAPVALGWTYLWGLVANLVGLAALLAVLPTLDRAADRPSWRNASWAVGAMALLYFAHEAMMIAACVAVAIFVIARPIDRRVLLRAAPAIAGTVFFVAQNRYQATMMTPSTAAVPTLYMPLSYKLASIPGILFGGHEVLLRSVAFALCAGATIAFVVARVRSRTEPFPRAPRAALQHLRFELLALALFGAFLAMPYTMGGATLVYERFLTPAYALAVVVAAAGTRARPLPRIVPVLAGSLPIASMLLVWPTFADADRAYRELDVVMPLVERNSAVAILEIGSNQPGRVFSMASGGGRVLPVRGGRTIYNLTDSPISAVMTDPENQWNDSLNRVIYDSDGFRPSFDCDRYRYVLAHVPGGIVTEVAKAAFEPDARPVTVHGEWLLLESTHYTVPMTAPDAPLPVPHPASLRKRMRAAYARILQEHGGDGPPPDTVIPSQHDDDLQHQ